MLACIGLETYAHKNLGIDDYIESKRPGSTKIIHCSIAQFEGLNEDDRRTSIFVFDECDMAFSDRRMKWTCLDNGDQRFDYMSPKLAQCFLTVGFSGTLT